MSGSAPSRCPSRAPGRPVPASPGAALLVALLVVTVVSALASGMVWQQWRAVRAETAERAQAQASWILVGAIDWARLILREDARGSQIDHLGEPWAVPLEEARLSTFLAGGREDLESNPALQAFVSGRIEDAQARFNLRNLAVEGPQGQAAQRALQRICTAARLPESVAGRLVEGVRRTWQPGRGEAQSAQQGAFLPPQRLDDLAWWGLDPASIDRLRPWLVVLPRPTALNLNTAAAELIAASIEGTDLSAAQRLVQARARSPLRSVQQGLTLLQGGGGETGAGVPLDVQSSHFEIQGRLRLDDRVFEERVLVERRQLEVMVLHRQRVTRMAP